MSSTLQKLRLLVLLTAAGYATASSATGGLGITILTGCGPIGDTSENECSINRPVPDGDIFVDKLIYDVDRLSFGGTAAGPAGWTSPTFQETIHNMLNTGGAINTFGVSLWNTNSNLVFASAGVAGIAPASTNMCSGFGSQTLTCAANAASGSSFGIDFRLQNMGATSISAAFTITQGVVPEPTTLALITLGMAGIGYSRKRKAT